MTAAAPLADLLNTSVQPLSARATLWEAGTPRRLDPVPLAAGSGQAQHHAGRPDPQRAAGRTARSVDRTEGQLRFSILTHMGTAFMVVLGGLMANAGRHPATRARNSAAPRARCPGDSAQESVMSPDTTNSPPLNRYFLAHRRRRRARSSPSPLRTSSYPRCRSNPLSAGPGLEQAGAAGGGVTLHPAAARLRGAEAADGYTRRAMQCASCSSCPGQRGELLRTLAPPPAANWTELMSLPEDAAGRLMDTRISLTAAT